MFLFVLGRLRISGDFSSGFLAFPVRSCWLWKITSSLPRLAGIETYIAVHPPPLPTTTCNYRLLRLLLITSAVVGMVLIANLLTGAAATTATTTKTTTTTATTTTTTTTTTSSPTVRVCSTQERMKCRSTTAGSPLQGFGFRDDVEGVGLRSFTCYRATNTRTG